MNKKEKPKPVLAAYLRLSRADKDLNAKEESNSISSQRELIQAYRLSVPELADMTYTEYVDDGYSGTTLARPSFQMMMQNARAGRIHCIIVKDMSRLSRDYITLGDYVEQLFPLNGIRFISINDAYDSNQEYAYLQSMNFALQGLFYDYYSKDLSKKRHASIEERLKNGGLPAHCPFGYFIDRKQYQFVIDPDAAWTVRLIYDLTLAGQPLPAIVSILNEFEIPTPSRYNRLHPKIHKPTSHPKQDLWKNEQVRKIIQNPVYKGTLVTHKSYTSLSEKVRMVRRPVLEHFIQENAHEPIVTGDEYEIACQIIRQYPYRKPSTGSKRKQTPPLALSGMIHCGHCGHVMHYEIDNHSMKCKYYYLEQTTCEDELYPLAVLDDYVYFHLKPILQQAIKEKAEQEHAVRKAKKRLQDYERQKNTLQQRQNDILEEKRKRFESFTSNTLTQAAFSEQMEQLTRSANALQEKISQIADIEAVLSSIQVSPEITALAEKAVLYLKIGYLTRDMVTDYLDKLILYGHDDYRIHWRYPDLFSQLLQKAQSESEPDPDSS